LPIFSVGTVIIIEPSFSLGSLKYKGTLIAFNKSGIAVNKKLHVGACVIDCVYQGEVHINLTNVGLIDQNINPGDKIVQVVLLELGNPSVEEVQDKDLFESESTRGDGKFGSSGVK